MAKFKVGDKVFLTHKFLSTVYKDLRWKSLTIIKMYELPNNGFTCKVEPDLLDTTIHDSHLELDLISHTPLFKALNEEENV